MYNRYILYQYAYYIYYYVYERSDSLVSTYIILYPVLDLRNLKPGANKNTAPLHRLRYARYAGCQHKTKCLNTNQKVYFNITNTFIQTIIFIYYTMCTRKLQDTLYNSLTHITQYSIDILEFYKLEIEDPIV